VDAAAMVAVDYEPLPAVVDMEAALVADASLQFEAMGTNLAAGRRNGAVVDPLAGADVVVRGRFENQRVAVAPMEGNAIAVVPGDDGAGHELTVHLSTQMPHLAAQLLCSVFGLPAGVVRVVTPNVGGAFGAKVGILAEHSVAVAVARRLGRPVKWVETRSENMVSSRRPPPPPRRGRRRGTWPLPERSPPRPSAGRRPRWRTTPALPS